MFPFDLNARFLLSHPQGQSPSLPFTWALSSVALEAEIDSASLELWAGSLLPDLSLTALNQPVSLVASQRSPQSLNALLTPLSSSVKPFILAPLTSGADLPQIKASTPTPLNSFLIEKATPNKHKLICEVATSKTKFKRGFGAAKKAPTPIFIKAVRKSFGDVRTKVKPLSLSNFGIAHVVERSLLYFPEKRMKYITADPQTPVDVVLGGISTFV